MPQNPAVYRHLSDHYLSLPHCRAIDLQAVCTEHDQPVLSVANRADLAGRGSEGTIHGGVITALVDVASASAVAAHLPDYEVLATLDMRIDYMHPALTDRAVQAKSTCYRLAGQVAFVRTLCYQEGQSDPVALGTATFMRTPLE
ncbi:MAG TPA: PaaI family thioesterase, partial [Neisseria sp.]|nr:PaaI family thioesterase [Neisseria sp.]